MGMLADVGTLVTFLVTSIMFVYLVITNPEVDKIDKIIFIGGAWLTILTALLIYIIYLYTRTKVDSGGDGAGKQ